MKIKDASVLGNKKEHGIAKGLISRTRWTEAAGRGETWKEYPRPSMKRRLWINLNGWWDYTFTQKNGAEKIFFSKVRKTRGRRSDFLSGNSYGV